VELPNNLDNSPLTAELAELRISLTAISPSGPGAQKQPENPHYRSLPPSVAVTWSIATARITLKI
jgi:hypothetical protein